MPPEKEKKSLIPIKVKALGVFMCAALVCSVMAALKGDWAGAAIALAIITHAHSQD